MDIAARKVLLFVASCVFLTLTHIGSIHSTSNLDWCPPDEFNCGCSLSEQEIGTGETSDSSPVNIQCESSDIISVLYFVPKHIRSVKINVAPDSTDQSLLPMTFFNFSQLEMLDLSDNAFVAIQPAAFHDAQMLTELKLSNNFLVELQEATFSGILPENEAGLDATYPLTYGLSNLQKLWLDNNDISFVADGVFANMTALHILDLTSNNLADINSFTFFGLSGLNRLSLAGNLLRWSNASFWQFLQNIRELDLSGNDISFVESESFAGLLNLYTLV